MRINSASLGFAIILATAICHYLINEIIVNNEILASYFSEQLSIKKIEQLLSFRNKWSWLNYILFIPIIYIIKFTLITLWILSATIFFGYKNTFKEIFRIVVISEFVWLIPSLITLIWFGFIDTDYGLVDVQYFKPLSLLNVFEASEIESWLIFPLQSLNLFEIACMFVLAIGIKRILKKGYIDALNFTVPVYGTALVTWIVFVTFLSINLTS